MTYDNSRFGALDMHMVVPSPGSPPGMSSSKSSKTSSLRSFGSDDDSSVLADAGHFEEIGLDDDTITIDNAHAHDVNQTKSGLNPYSSSFTADLRAQSTRHVGPKIHPAQSTSTRDLARPRSQRDITQKTRPQFPAIRTQFRDTSTQGLSSIGPQPHTSPLPIRSLSARSASALGSNRRHRSPSPNLSLRSLSPKDPNIAPKPRRSSWQSTLERKSVIELEKECDEDDDNIPEGFILDNIPISPRPPVERSSSRSTSRPVSASTSPDRQPQERVRSVGNGTPPVAAAQGSLRSPSWRSEASSNESITSPGICPSPLKGRAKSWNSALSELSAEAKALTEKLEEHFDELDKTGVSGGIIRPTAKPRVKSALAELPPLRRTNIMIDPLPISKEKEAVLSRTRPSWLPPKDPAEEKKHLKEYQRLMANSIETDRRRQAAREKREKNKDAMASNLARVWEEDVLKRWNDAIRERRTRELWWKGVAPRTRGNVWSQAIGNELGLTETSFLAALNRAHEVEARMAQGKASTEDERKAKWLEKIRADTEGKTWGELNIFQIGGPLHQPLVDVLSAYAMYRSDIGYVNGSNTIAAILLLNLPSPTMAFIALANVLNRPLPLSFYASDNGAKASAYNLLLQTLSTKAPQLHKHLTSTALAIEPEDYLLSIFTALFTQHLSLDECTRLWDVYVFEGDALLVRAAVALLMQREPALLAAGNSSEVLQALAEGAQKTLQGREDDWMQRVREAGKA
ncbi:putative Rab-GTPase-TBC domain-containing protein [Seiridium unicorne]|uniref:Rab-GTPase-TBC domain-containing protein n=1 Tax=Seiridium unicorne TaxID=138068 RepID=A0ABR2UY39_9PEZI